MSAVKILRFEELTMAKEPTIFFAQIACNTHYSECGLFSTAGIESMQKTCFERSANAFINETRPRDINFGKCACTKYTR